VDVAFPQGKTNMRKMASIGFAIACSLDAAIPEKHQK
jgi:hypothetical protein